MLIGSKKRCGKSRSIELDYKIIKAKILGRKKRLIFENEILGVAGQVTGNENIYYKVYFFKSIFNIKNPLPNPRSFIFGNYCRKKNGRKKLKLTGIAKIYMENEYVEKFLKAIKRAKDDNKIEIIINKIYEDGFEDGFEDGNIE